VTGSSYVAIVVPIIAFTAMAFWLGLVFYADSHPGSRDRQRRQQPSETARSQAAGRLAGDDPAGLSPSAGTSETVAPSPDAGIVAGARGPG